MKKNIFFILISIITVFIGCKEDAPTKTSDDPNKVYYDGGPNVDSKGVYYTTVKIGNQLWLKENLNIGTMIESGSQLQTDNGTIEKYCYNNETSNCDTNGGLYEWNEAMQYNITAGTQGICPSGWHIPTRAEWETLLETIGDNSNAYKAEGQGGGNGAGTNISGFSALLAGYHDSNNPNGVFNYLGISTNIWSSTESGSNAYDFNLNYYNSSIFFYDDSKDLGFSIRCLKD